MSRTSQARAMSRNSEIEERLVHVTSMHSFVEQALAHPWNEYVGPSPICHKPLDFASNLLNKQ